MKKLSIFAALAIAALGFTACSDDDTPVFTKPAEGSFKLNTPALAEQTYELTEEGSIVLTCSQPDYGFTASVNYGVEVAIKEDPAEDEIYVIVPQEPTSAVIRINSLDVATAICTLNGIKTDEDWANNPLGEAPVYLRATAQLGANGQNPDSFITSNWVKLSHVVPFFAVPQPGAIYLIGSPAGWIPPEEQKAADLKAWRLLEPGDDIGCQIYSQTFEIPAGDLYFRFYTKLEGWDANSLGPNEDEGYDKKEDNGAWNVFFHDTNFLTPFNLELQKDCKNNFVFLGFEGGSVTFTVDLSGDVPNVTITQE